MPTLSVILATHNEADNLGRCLHSVKSIADEIVVVDGNSTDATVAIARSFKAHVVEVDNQANFHLNKQLALKEAKGDWILQLDADEQVSPDLAQEIKETITMTQRQIRQRQFPPQKRHLFARHQANLALKNTGNIVAFFIPRLNLFLGRPLKHGGVYPDGVIRLFQRGKAHFPAKSVHEQVKVDGAIDWLQHDLLHHDSPTFAKYLHRANRYTDLTAKEFLHQKLEINLKNHLRYLFIKPTADFLLRFIRHKAFLDRFPGFVFALFSALHWPIAYIKYYQQVKAPVKAFKNP